MSSSNKNLIAVIGATETSASEVGREQDGFETESGNQETRKAVMICARHSWLHSFQSLR